MKIVAAISLMLMLAGCAQQHPMLDKCESAIKARLKSPSTYHRVTDVDDGIGEQMGYYEIDFDAVNSFNAPIRDHASCFVEDGKVSVYLKSEMQPGV